MPSDRSFPLLLLCFFLSGLAALIYETAWTREFTFVFGTSELAVTTVLSAYMGGLAAGAAIAGRVAPRLSRPVLAYGMLELGIAGAAFAVPLGVEASRWLYVAIFGGRDVLPDAGGLTTSLFYLVCSFAILLVPTAMMGATLPLLARHAVRDEEQIGRRIGTLYAINTTGAVAGTLLAAFWLLPAIGLRATTAAAAAVNALVFAAAYWLARVAGRATTAFAPEGAPQTLVWDRALWILPLIFASGFVSFTYEVLWVRLMGHLVGAGVEAFGTMLASFLAGIALGAAAAARLASSPKRASMGFALAQLGVAAMSTAAFAFVDRIPSLAVTLRGQGIERVWSQTAICMLTLFPSALCIGATFPFAVRVLARHTADAGPASARVYSANTVGSIAGSVAAGFFLVPGLGFAGTLVACVAANLALSAAASLLFDPRRLLVLATAVLAGAGLAIAPPDTPWKMLRASSMVGGTDSGGRIHYYGVGRSSTVMLIEQPFSYNLRTNGLPEAGMQRPESWPDRYPLTRWLGALPVMARPEAHSLLLVGLGGGMAIEVVPPSIQRIDVIELEPEVLEANRSVSALRWRDPLADPRVHIHLNDARNALLLASDARFDAIVSQPSHPWAGGAAHLYTQEFFELVRSRLAPGGVFVQWIGLPFVDEELFRSLLATMTAVFPYVNAFDPPPGSSVLFLASEAPLDVQSSVRRALAAAPDDFALLGIKTPEDVLASLLLDASGVREVADGAATNRDARNRLQNRSDRLPIRESLLGTVYDLCGPVDPLVHSPRAGTELFGLLRRLEPKRAQRVALAASDPIDREVGAAVAEIALGKQVSARRRLATVLAQQPRHREARAAFLQLSVRSIANGTHPEKLLEPPLEEAERTLAAAWLARAQNPKREALAVLDGPLAAIPLFHPLGLDAVRLRIQARLQGGEPERVREAVRLAEQSLGDRPEPQDLLLRAEAYAAGNEAPGALEAIDLFIDRLDHRLPSSGALWHRARQLARTIPDDPEFRSLRINILRRLGVGA